MCWCCLTALLPRHQLAVFKPWHIFTWHDCRQRAVNLDIWNHPGNRIETFKPSTRPYEMNEIQMCKETTLQHQISMFMLLAPYLLGTDSEIPWAFIFWFCHISHFISMFTYFTSECWLVLRWTFDLFDIWLLTYFSLECWLILHPAFWESATVKCDFSLSAVLK